MILVIDVDFHKAANPSLRRVDYPIPQFFSADAEPFNVENSYLRSTARRINRKSMKTVAEHVAEFVAWRLGANKEICDLSDDDLDYFIDAQCSYIRRNGQRLAWNTVNSRAGAVHRLLVWCQLNGHCTDIKLQTIPRTGMGAKVRYKIKGHPSRKLEEPTKFLLMDTAIAYIRSIGSLSALGSATSMRNVLLAKLMLQCGLRLSEAVNFPIKDLPEIRLNGHSTPARIIGKGGKRRVILIPNRLLAELWEYHDVVRKSILEDLTSAAKQGNGEPNLFISDRGKRITGNWVEKIFARAGSRIGVKAVPHALRHTFGTYHYLYNKDVLFLSKLMGHQSVETTERFYVHAATLISHSGKYEELQEEIDRRCLEARL